MRVFGRVERIEHGIIAAIDRKIVIFGIDRKSIYDFFLSVCRSAYKIRRAFRKQIGGNAAVFDCYRVSVCDRRL